MSSEIVSYKDVFGWEGSLAFTTEEWTPVADWVLEGKSTLILKIFARLAFPYRADETSFGRKDQPAPEDREFIATVNFYLDDNPDEILVGRARLTGRDKIPSAPRSTTRLTLELIGPMNRSARQYPPKNTSHNIIFADNIYSTSDVRYEKKVSYVNTDIKHL